MNHFIITPTRVSHDTNPGGHLITGGLKWLLLQADPEAMFWDVPLFAYSPKTWAMMSEIADTLIYAGHPRFSANRDVCHYWDTEVWDHIERAIDGGVKFIDAWAGGSYHFSENHMSLRSVNEMRDEVRGIEWVRRIMRVEARSTACIARDVLAEAVFAPDVPYVKRLPCCSWYARRYYGVPAKVDKRYNLIVPAKHENRDGVCQRFAEWAGDMTRDNGLPTKIVAHESMCADWCKKNGLTDVITVYDPASLLRLFSRCENMMSMRVHASIPAMSLGAYVWHIGNDARLLTVEEFGVTALDKGLPEGYAPDFQGPDVMPDHHEAINALSCGIRGS